MSKKHISRFKFTISLEEALNDFLVLKKAQGISDTTYKDYRDYVTRFFKRYPDAWQSATLKKCALEYMSQDIKPATYNLRLTYLGAFFKWCVKEGYLAENPFAELKLRKAEPRIVDIPEEALQNLLNIIDKTTFAGLRDYALILFTLDTGARPKEALSLRIEHFDLAHYAVTIPAEIAKTRTTRTLPILDVTAAAIRKLIRVRPEEWPPDTPVFCKNDGEPMDRRLWEDRLANYSREIGVKIRPYDLRHAFALMYLRNGGNAFGLQQTLGHTDISMTKRYVHMTGRDLREDHWEASPLKRLVSQKKKKKRVGKIK